MKVCTKISLLAGGLALLLAAASWQPVAHGGQAASVGTSAIPQIIQFSGTLADAQAGTVSITFSLFQEEQGGSALWSETDNVEVDAQGHYTALLGSGSVNGLPLNLFVTAQAHWLAVQPALPGSAELPRVLLVSAPYALKAGDAETIGGLPPSAFVRADTSLAAQGTAAIPTSMNGGSIPNSASANGVSASANQQPPTTPANYNVTTGYQINGSYVVTTPGSTNAPSTALGSLALSHLSSGVGNVGAGFAALFNDTTGGSNVAVGFGALNFNTSGGANTALGTEALYNNTTAGGNVAVGGVALYSNTTGAYNTASGEYSMHNNTTASNGTAAGYQSLYSNTTGASNAATGYDSLYSNTTGNYNAADGAYVLYKNTTGSANSGLGYGALYNNTTANYNAANGNDALFSNTTGANNTASGVLALYNNTTGSNSIAVGYQAAMNVSGGNGGNIEIGNLGSSGDVNTIRLGTSGTQTSAFIAGIYGVSLPSGGQPLVCVNSSGQLGTSNCATPGLAQADALKHQQEQIKAQADKIAALEQRLSKLEALIARQ